MMDTRRQAHERIERHDVGPLDDWRSSLRNVGERRAVIVARAPLPSDGTELLECDCDLAALHSLFEGGSRAVAARLASGAGAAAAAALCQGAAGGSVLLAEPEGQPRSIPAGDARLTPATWRDGLALACAARDGDALAVLCSPAAVAACQLPAGHADAFWPHYCNALACAVVAPDQFAEHERAARAGMDEARTASLDAVAGIDRPLLDLARLLVEGDARGWNAAVARALEAHRAYYADESRRFDRRGFLSFGILGLCAVAHERGMETHVESPYLPAELVQGLHPVELSTVTYVCPPRTLVHDGEAGWFLDLVGFPRAHRSHRLFERDGDLLARYAAHGAPGLPHARIDFVLADEAALAAGDDAALPPPAVDAGELLWLAQAFATQAGDPSLPAGERRALLSEAVACVDAALARIPSGAEEVPPDTIRGARGRALREAEPGRFRRVRMEAYRDALAGALDRLDAEIASGDRGGNAGGPSPENAGGSDGDSDSYGDSDSDGEARASAFASMELIRAQVMPILEAIARDRTGEVARMLRPRDEDYARVFTGDAVEAARRGYQAVWSAPLDLAPPSAGQTQLLCYLAPAGMLADDNELSRHFPAGFRGIAHRLDPHRVWVRWKYVRPGETSGIAYDGLVWCDDHWAWFPKPYRVLADLPA